jgi:hypothetical protein
MSGSGAVFNNTGTFAIGNSTTNLSFNGSQMTLNGNVVATGNINANAVTNIMGNTTAGSASLSGTAQTIVSESFTTSGGTVIVSYSALLALNAIGGPGLANFTIIVARDGTTIYEITPAYYYPATSATAYPLSATIIDSPASGSHTYTITAKSTGSDTTITSAFLVLQEFKR